VLVDEFDAVSEEVQLGSGTAACQATPVGLNFGDEEREGGELGGSEILAFQQIMLQLAHPIIEQDEVGLVFAAKFRQGQANPLSFPLGHLGSIEVVQVSDAATIFLALLDGIDEALEFALRHMLLEDSNHVVVQSEHLVKGAGDEIGVIDGNERQMLLRAVVVEDFEFAERRLRELLSVELVQLLLGDFADEAGVVGGVAGQAKKIIHEHHVAVDEDWLTAIGKSDGDDLANATTRPGKEFE